MHFVDSKRQPLFHPPRNLLLFCVHYIHFYLQQLPFTIVSRPHPCCSLTSDGKPWWQTHPHHSSQLGFAEKMIVHHKFCQQKKTRSQGTHTLVVTHERRASSKSHCWIESRDGPSILMHCHIDSRKSYALLRYWERYHFGAQHSRNLSFYTVIIVATDIPHRKHSEIEGWIQKA